VITPEDDEFTNEQGVTKLVSEQLRPESVVKSKKLKDKVHSITGHEGTEV
jgi:hypothetical protein